MAYGTQQNNVRDKASVNTRGYQFTNKNGFDPSALSVGFWNDFLSIRINPALEKSQQTETRVFDYDKSVSTALSLRLIVRMLHGIENCIIPAIESGESHSISVQVGGDSLITIGTGTKYTNNKVCQYLAIHKELDPSTRKPAMSMFYEFSTDNIIKDYNESDGSYNIDSNINDEFKLFVQILKSAIIGLSKSTVHADRVVNRFNNDKLQTNVAAIGDKVGAKMMGTGTGSSGWSKSNVDFSGGSESNYEGEYSSLSDLDSLG